MKIGFLVSGSLGDVVLRHFEQSYDISFVMTDSTSVQIIEFCNQKKIPLFIGNPRNKKVNRFIAHKECDVIASVNYLFLIQKNIIDLAKDLCFNIHGSLLPKYRGRTPHVWAIINNEKVISETIKNFGKIDIFIYNSGGPKPGTFDEISLDDWDLAYNSVLKYNIRMIKECLPYMEKNNWGRIINITSLSVKEPASTLLLSNVFRTGVCRSSA